MTGARAGDGDSPVVVILNVDQARSLVTLAQRITRAGRPLTRLEAVDCTDAALKIGKALATRAAALTGAFTDVPVTGTTRHERSKEPQRVAQEPPCICPLSNRRLAHRDDCERSNPDRAKSIKDRWEGWK